MQVETINGMKTNREFFLSFAKDPQLFINKWLISQSRGEIKHTVALETKSMPNARRFLPQT